MIQSIAGGIILNVRVIPRAAKSGLAGTRGDALLVRLHAPPVEGAANTELIDVIAHALDVPRSRVAIVGGSRSRQKRVRVEGIDAPTATARLTAQGEAVRYLATPVAQDFSPAPRRSRLVQCFG